VSEWPDTTMLVRRELLLYLEAASRADSSLPTRCPPWSVRDVTAHLAATFERYARNLERGRSGDLTPPFAPDELDAENHRAVEEFVGDPELVLADEAERFLQLVGDLDELMPHQLGPIAVGQQLYFGLRDLAIHHDDIAAASGAAYRPGADVVDVLDEMSTKLGRYGDGDRDESDLWASLLRLSGR
jgi:uncharacterized protein (TIGR03083 family)